MQIDGYANIKANSLRRVVDILNDKHIVLPTFDEIDLKLLNSRKKIKLFSGVTQEKFYVSLFFIELKSRFLKKSADEIMALQKRLEEFKKHTYKIKFLLISSPLCSKAKSFLSDNGWRVVEVKDDTL